MIGGSGKIPRRRIIIAGTRTAPDEETMRAIDAGSWQWRFDGDVEIEVVSGGCRGPDLAGERWARERGYAIKRFDADWKTHGRAAGPIRNRAMAEYADSAIIVWDGVSRGAKSMIREALDCGLQVAVMTYKPISSRHQP